ncbi:hypothetical protein GCM10009642_20980 [Nocardiopsis metallicus]
MDQRKHGKWGYAGDVPARPHSRPTARWAAPTRGFPGPGPPCAGVGRVVAAQPGRTAATNTVG